MKKDPLFILPFDHRSFFLKKMGVEGREPSSNETKKIKEFKEVIYMGFKQVIESGGIPKKWAAILVDDQFGEKIIEDAIASGYIVSVSTEKSGQEEFEFEHGAKFGEYLDRYQPSFAKALVRYNPEGNQDLNARQREKLKRLSDLCKKRAYGLIIEPLVLATDDQMSQVNGEKKRYDNEMRPGLMVKMIEEMRGDGIAPDTWKIEGLDSSDDYRKLVDAIGGDANAVVLGRGADDSQVEKWILAGAEVNGIVGFAIGRTIFWDSLVDYSEGRITKEIAAKRIGEKYKRFYDIFTMSKKKYESFEK